MKTCTVCLGVYPENLRFCPADGTALPISPASAFPIGEVVNGYRVIDRMSQGGFGETFLVDRPDLRRRAVMKVLFATDPEVFERLRREFGLLSTLDEPAFAHVYDFGMAWDNRPYLMMELVQGTTLHVILKARGRLSVPDALAVGLRLARGLGRLHDAGFIHRDIKPTNIIIPERHGRAAFVEAKLLDFGVFGLLVQEGSSRLTRTGMIAGTPRYMAPEQIQGLQQSPGTDVYGLALLLVEMLYGRLPFESDAGSAIALMARIAQTDLTIPEDPAVPPELRALLSRSLSRDPSLRPADGAAFAEELAALVPLPPADVVTYRPSPPSAAAAATARHTGSVRVHRRSSGIKQLASPQPMRASTTWAFRGVLFAAVLLVAVLFLLLRREQAGPVPATTLAPVLWIAVGVTLAVGGILLGNVVRRLARSRLHDVEIDAERLLLGLSTKRALSDTIQVEVAQIITRCRELDERLLGVTILKMISEYDEAKESDQRQTALMNVATLLEKLRGRLSPWYARFEKQLALATAVVGVASGVISMVAGLIKVANGH